MLLQHYMFSNDIALLPVMYFSDVLPNGGGTAIAEGSHFVAADILRQAGVKGMTSKELTQAVLNTGTEFDVVELTGRTGDIVLLHPLLLHARSTNLSPVGPEGVRFMCHPSVGLRKPLAFSGPLCSMTILEQSLVLGASGRAEEILAERNRVMAKTEEPEAEVEVEVTTEAEARVEAKTGARVEPVVDPLVLSTVADESSCGSCKYEEKHDRHLQDTTSTPCFHEPCEGTCSGAGVGAASGSGWGLSSEMESLLQQTLADIRRITPSAVASFDEVHGHAHHPRWYPSHSHNWVSTASELYQVDTLSPASQPLISPLASHAVECECTTRDGNGSDDCEEGNTVGRGRGGGGGCAGESEPSVFDVLGFVSFKRKRH